MPATAARGEAASAVRGTGDPRTALRVTVEVLSRSSGTLLVRMLGANDKAPPGASEALLVPLQTGLDLRDL